MSKVCFWCKAAEGHVHGCQAEFSAGGAQDNWFALCGRYGEPKARALLVAKLRAFADQIERDGYPDVFGCKVQVPESTDLAAGITLETISVTLSYPWGG